MHQVNREILKVWEECPNEQTPKLIPLLYPTEPKLKTNAILFVGLNPSFSESGFKNLLEGKPYRDLDPNKFYAYPMSGEFDQKISDEMVNEAKEKHRYFGKFRKIDDYIGIGWEHVDLFFIRETSQDNMKKRIFEKGENLNEFGLKQLGLSKRLIAMCKPRIIVVANALASDIFKKYFSPDFCEETGCHFLDINGKSTPVFLSSMLTGQRALDNHSFERLKWHIKKVLN
jgi:hypothetical protein